MANEQRRDFTIKQNSFVNSIKKYILSSNNPIMRTDDITKRNKILKNYWKAISNLINVNSDLDNSALFKTIGLDLFNQVSPAVFSQLFLNKNFKVETIEDLLRKAFDEKNKPSSKG